MMTSILLVDVQGLEARIGGGLSPAELLAELTHTMHGMSRQIMVQRAYCSSRISTYRRNAYRDAGYQIIETAGPDETLIMMTLDLADLSGGNAVYEEAILLGGTADYTALARLAHENLMMISVMDHPTIQTSLEALADGLIDPDELPVSDTPSLLERSDSKRDEQPRKSPFLAPPPKESILAPTAKPEPAKSEPAKSEPAEPDMTSKSKADNAEPGNNAEPTSNAKSKGHTETKTDADLKSDVEVTEEAVESETPALGTTDDADGDEGTEDTDSGDTESGDTESGDTWPDPKTGPILVAGGSIAEAVGLTTALDDPIATASEEGTSTQPSEPTDPIEAELANEIASDLSVSAEDIGIDADEAPGSVIIDLQIEDLVAEEFAETPAPTTSALQTSDDTKVAEELAADDDPLDALFADLGADLTPESPQTVSAATSADPLDSLDIAPADLLEDLDPLEPVTLEKTPESAGESPNGTNEPVEETAKASSKELSEEVDELLSRLMSDGPSGAPAEDVQLDVVPER